MQPKAVTIAGANGAGKTTFARRILPIDHPECAFLNADEIQREDLVFSSPAAAGRELIRRLADQTARTQSFAIETTLSSAQHLRRIPQWHAQGYKVWLYFLEVESADLAVARVAHRVMAGGHDIPEADIRRRYTRGLALFPAYRTAADAGIILRSMQEVQCLSLKKPPEKPAMPDVHAERAIEAMRRATDDVRKGVPDALAGRFNPVPKKAAE